MDSHYAESDGNAAVIAFRVVERDGWFLESGVVLHDLAAPKQS